MRSTIKKSKPRIAFEIFNTVFFIGVIIVSVLPLWHVFCASFSDASWVIAQNGLIWHIHNFSLEGYKLVMQYKDIWNGYINTFLYVGGTTAIGMLVTVMMAYTVSRKDSIWGKVIMYLVSFTMLFIGGMIASYIVTANVLHLYDTRWAVILPVCLNAFYLILIRTAIQSVPESLIESAQLDGAGHMVILFRIVLPLIKATLATVILYYIIMQWNSWFSASIYLRTRSKFPLQLILKEILVSNDTSAMSAKESQGSVVLYKQLLKYCTIIISTGPILLVYPFVQRYFESGVMIGAVKG
ncbi:MAG: carbohydrate ABC transporter permease [Eubacteriales bacterium]|nr:carbohydrate ABC transporter permease [Eubacteriales bacterium]